MKKSVIAAVVATFLGISMVEAAEIPEALTIRPYEEILFNDNVFLKPAGDKNGSGISRTGLQLAYERNRGDFTFGIQGDVTDVRYWRFSGLDYVGYSLTPQVKYAQGNWRLTLGGQFSYDLTPVDSTNSTKYNTYSNGSNLLFDYDVSEKTGVAIDGSWGQKIYDGKSELDHNEFFVGIAPYYKLSEKTKFGLHTGYGSRFYDVHIQQLDSNWILFNTFVDYKLTGQLESHFEAGYMTYQTDGINGIDGESQEGMNAKASLNYKASSKWSFDLALSNGLTDAYTATPVAKSKLKNQTDVSLKATWKVTDKFSIAQSIIYGITDDKSQSMDSAMYGYKIDASYMIGQHADISVGYSYSNTNYSHVVSDYDENIVKVGFGWKF